MDPWGTPIVIGSSDEDILLITTFCDLLVKYDFIRSSGVPRIPYRSSLLNNMLWSNVSKALVINSFEYDFFYDFAYRN